MLIGPWPRARDMPKLPISIWHRQPLLDMQSIVCQMRREEEATPVQRMPLCTSMGCLAREVWLG